ncbi:MAG: hypothetical protein JXM70_17130 [Pirellulales bacterium]|nr:hypothetical protein [Pirellulales bacterium]
MNRTANASILVIAIATVSLLAVCGCDAPSSQHATINLTGTVKVNGAAVEQGRIRFNPTKPDQAEAAEGPISDGHYKVDNAPVGNVLVTFVGLKKTGRTVEMFGKKAEETVNIIPTKYSRGLSVTINGDGNRNFDLK